MVDFDLINWFDQQWPLQALGRVIVAPSPRGCMVELSLQIECRNIMLRAPAGAGRPLQLWLGMYDPRARDLRERIVRDACISEVKDILDLSQLEGRITDQADARQVIIAALTALRDFARADPAEAFRRLQEAPIVSEGSACFPSRLTPLSRP